jgi:nucleoside-diphosphate-sugar epimerase
VVEVKIVGNGFLATSLSPLVDSHQQVTAFVSGVSSASEKSELEFAREGRLLHEVLLSCRRGGRTLVYFSTTSVGMLAVDDVGGRAGREDGPVYPGSQYGRHKLSMEAMITSSDAKYLILRLATPVGPQQRSHQFLPSMINQVLKGSVRILLGARRDLIYIDDVLAILDNLLGAGVSSEVVNVASGVAAPITDIVGYLERQLQRQPRWTISGVPVERAVSIAKLRRLVPMVADMDFGATYYQEVIDRYLVAAARRRVCGDGNPGACGRATGVDQRGFVERGSGRRGSIAAIGGRTTSF